MYTRKNRPPDAAGSLLKKVKPPTPSGNGAEGLKMKTIVSIAYSGNFRKGVIRHVPVEIC